MDPAAQTSHGFHRQLSRPGERMSLNVNTAAMGEK